MPARPFSAPTRGIPPQKLNETKRATLKSQQDFLHYHGGRESRYFILLAPSRFMCYFRTRATSMFKKLKQKIPEKYFDEFAKEQTSFIKSRVTFLCLITVVIYFMIAALDMAVSRDSFFLLELGAGAVLIAAGLVTLYLGRRVKSLAGSKMTAYMFTAVLLLVMIRIGIDYSEDPLISSAGYVFTLFLVTITIPWTPREVVPLWLMHSAAFTAEFMYLRQTSSGFQFSDYVNAELFIFVTFFLCLVVRKKETDRDVENFILLKEVEEKNEQARKELEWARRVHMTIIPDSCNTDLVDISVTYLPVYYVGGDYTRYVFLGDDRITFLISDVTGHGVPAALLVNRIHAEFERMAKEGTEPGVLMRDLNVFIKQDFEGAEMYLTAFCGQLDLKKMKLLYSNYGHPPQYLYDVSENSIRSLPAQTGMLGLPLEDSDVYQDETHVDVGDRIFMYTDGVTEAMNPEGEEYGDKRVETLLMARHTLKVSEFNVKLMEELDAFKGPGEFKDDICVLDIAIKGHSGFLGWHTH
jgi:serine phosphatase RsbU (regulator of sigma subunit)